MLYFTHFTHKITLDIVRKIHLRSIKNTKASFKYTLYKWCIKNHYYIIHSKAVPRTLASIWIHSRDFLFIAVPKCVYIRCVSPNLFYALFMGTRIWYFKSSHFCTLEWFIETVLEIYISIGLLILQYVEPLLWWLRRQIDREDIFLQYKQIQWHVAAPWVPQWN